MHNTFSGILGLIDPLFLAASIATAAPPAKAAEDRYIAARDVAIEKISEALLHTECAKAALLCGSNPAGREAAFRGSQ